MRLMEPYSYSSPMLRKFVKAVYADWHICANQGMSHVGTFPVITFKAFEKPKVLFLSFYQLLVASLWQEQQSLVSQRS